MPFCPSCGAEYRAGIVRCTDCDVELVTNAPETESTSEPEEGTELAVLASFSTVSEAEMVQELLEGNSIKTVIRGDRDPIGATSGAAPTTLLVEERDLAGAREIYDAYFGGVGTGSEEGEEGLAGEASADASAAAPKP